MKASSILNPGAGNEPLYIDKSTLTGAGSGLFTNKPIKKGEIICYFTGDLISEAEAIKRDVGERGHYFVQLASGKILDTYSSESYARYANDARNKTKNNSKIFSATRGAQAYISAIKNIPAGSEIFVDYGVQYWKAIDAEKG